VQCSTSVGRKKSEEAAEEGTVTIEEEGFNNTNARESENRIERDAKNDRLNKLKAKLFEQ